MGGIRLGTIGLAVLLTRTPVPVSASYFCLFLIVSGGLVAQLLTVSQVIDDWSGHNKRAVAIQALPGFGNVGGTTTSTIFLHLEAPHYQTGYGTSMALLLFAGAMSTIMFFRPRAENKKRMQEKPDDRLT